MKLKINFESGPVEVETEGVHEHNGIKFFAHEVINFLNSEMRFRASEYSTGCGLPKTYSCTAAGAITAAKSVIDRNPIERIKASMARMKIVNRE